MGLCRNDLEDILPINKKIDILIEELDKEFHNTFLNDRDIALIKLPVLGIDLPGVTFEDLSPLGCMQSSRPPRGQQI
jgi:hypothetical protein